MLSSTLLEKVALLLEILADQQFESDPYDSVECKTESARVSSEERLSSSRPVGFPSCRSVLRSGKKLWCFASTKRAGC